MMDDKGSYRILRYSGGLAEQPAIDMRVIDVVRAQWTELKNQDLEEKIGSQSKYRN
jgi:hypothetical protein